MGMGGGQQVPSGGLSPMQRELYNEGDALFQKYKRFGAPMAREQTGQAAGGLMLDGMRAVNKGLADQSPVAGMQSRQAARFGVTLSPDQQGANDQVIGATDTANSVAVQNQARVGLTNAMQVMRGSGGNQ